jgi:RNA polymerase sigma factor (RpoD-like family)
MKSNKFTTTQVRNIGVIAKITGLLKIDLQDLDTEKPENQDDLNTGMAEVNKISNDTIGTFFKEMSRYPLLTATEEIELSRKVKFLQTIIEVERHLTETLEHKPSIGEIAKELQLTEKQLQIYQHQGEIAKRKMIRSNLRLVVSIAKKYLHRGVPFLDLIQEGSLGLNRAVEKFDPDKGYKFSTYAYWWVRQAISRTIANDSRTIRLPVHIVEKLNKIKRVQRELKQELQRNPTEKELLNCLQMSVDQLHKLLQLKRRSLSLNHRVGQGEETELVDLLEDNENLSPEAIMNERMMRQDLWEVLSEVLTEREQEVIALRYGLNSPQPCTLDEVGCLFNLSRERVRQIQTKAMRKLRRPQVTKRLKAWLFN